MGCLAVHVTSDSTKKKRYVFPSLAGQTKDCLSQLNVLQSTLRPRSLLWDEMQLNSSQGNTVYWFLFALFGKYDRT
ncbi:hypothetical protein EYF80_001034 [Liparis tanakae]|uniref:Uncharacterized protein n=1 Tax=Liparis tanakae TaxID=230148 RepID=A0A4Z2JHG3_9TELE|nr:hypothetical protein EYF80_001034 [Liparis tanakae]